MSMGRSAAHRAAPFIIGILALCLVGAAQASGQGLKPSRVHFVDRVGNNALFRGNEPLGNGSSETFAYDALIEEITKKVSPRAVLRNCVPPPSHLRSEADTPASPRPRRPTLRPTGAWRAPSTWWT